MGEPGSGPARPGADPGPERELVLAGVLLGGAAAEVSGRGAGVAGIGNPVPGTPSLSNLLCELGQSLSFCYVGG